VGDEVAAYGYPNNAEQVTVTRGIVSRISSETYAHSSVKLLSCQIDAAINAGSSGGPIISGNRIVGIAMMAGWGDDEGYMVSVPVIKHFFTDIEDGRYDGFPDLALNTQTLENPIMQEYYGLTDELSGVLIRDVYYRSPAKGLLYPGDVVLQINRYEVAGDGTVAIRSGERTDYVYAVQEKQAGEFAHVKVLRDKEVRDIAVKLDFKIFDHNVVHFSQYDHRPKYFIYGVLVFRRLLVVAQPCTDQPDACPLSCRPEQPEEGDHRHFRYSSR
jgi:S1-C subfamily serine protease